MTALDKFNIIKGLWLCVKNANDEEIAMDDLADGIPDGETADENFDYIVENFEYFLKLYSPLARRAAKSGLYDPETETVFAA